jgi:hypothetical protein
MLYAYSDFKRGHNQFHYSHLDSPRHQPSLFIPHYLNHVG